MAYKLKENIPTTMTFPFGDFEEKEGDYGPQWMYAINVEGQKDYLYANQKLHNALQKAGVAKGATLTVTLTKEGRSHVYTVTGGAGPAPAGKPSPQRPQQAPGGLTFADISFAYRECLFAASAHLSELASLEGETPRLVDFAVVQAAAATMMIQCDRAGCVPRVPKAEPKLDGEHTVAFVKWFEEYAARTDIAGLWRGKADFAHVILAAAGMESKIDVMAANDPDLYRKVQEAIMAETALRQEARDAQQTETTIDTPF